MLTSFHWQFKQRCTFQTLNFLPTKAAVIIGKSAPSKTDPFMSLCEIRINFFYAALFLINKFTNSFPIIRNKLPEGEKKKKKYVDKAETNTSEDGRAAAAHYVPRARLQRGSTALHTAAPRFLPPPCLSSWLSTISRQQTGGDGHIWCLLRNKKAACTQTCFRIPVNYDYT